MKDSTQQPLFAPKTEYILPQTFPDLSSSKHIAIDFETRDDQMNEKEGMGWPTGKGYVVGFSVAVEGWSAYYPFKHQGGGNLDEKLVLKYIKEICELPVPKIFHNAMYDLGWIKKMGFKVNGRCYDTMIMASLCDENRLGYHLDGLGKEFLNMGKSENLLRAAAKEWNVDPKSEMWKLPGTLVGEYAEQDAVVTLELFKYLYREIGKQGIESITKLEHDLLPLLIDMTYIGVRIDEEQTSKVGKQIDLESKSLLREIKQETNVDLEVWNARSVAKVFDYYKLTYPRTEKTDAPSFTKGFLETHPHPMVQKILDIRALAKTRSSFVDKLQKHTVNGRVHAQINQIRSDDGGTVTGRFSMSNPNLQQIPRRNKKIGNMIRALFLPDEGKMWGSFDYSQQEPRLVAHYAQSVNEGIGLPGAEEIIKNYAEHDLDFHSTVAEMTGIPRDQAKTISLGLFYGMGINKLRGELGIDEEEARNVLAQYNAKVPFVKILSQRVTDKASDDGEITTILGRRCRFPFWEARDFNTNFASRSKPLTFEEAKKKYAMDSEGRTWLNKIKRAYTYRAFNRLIQGSAADQTKKAMVDLYNETGFIPHIQVHDELNLSVANQEDAIKVKDVMEQCMDGILVVPSKVDYALGKNWAECK